MSTQVIVRILLKFVFLLSQVWSQVLTSTDIPNPRSLHFKRCGLSRAGYLCDPDHILTEASRTALQEFLEAWPRDTPCFCRKPCSLDQNGLSQRLIIGALVLDRLPRPNVSEAAYAEAVRANWMLGSCPGNDVLMLAIGSKVHLAYGSLVSRALTPDCIKSLPGSYDVKQSVNRTIHHLSIILREFFVNPCMCRSCKNAYSWFKIPAMLLACFCLLMWLSLVGRRAYLRRMHLPVARNGAGCCSLTDLDYMVNNRAYLVRLPPRTFTAPRLVQSNRVLVNPSRFARGSRLTRHSDSSVGPEARCPSVVVGPPNDHNNASFIACRRRSPSPPPPPYASVTKWDNTSSANSVQPADGSKLPTFNRNSSNPCLLEAPDEISRPPSYSDILALARGAAELSPSPPTLTPHPPGRESHAVESGPTSSSDAATHGNA